MGVSKFPATDANKIISSPDKVFTGHWANLSCCFCRGLNITTPEWWVSDRLPKIFFLEEKKKKMPAIKPHTPQQLYLFSSYSLPSAVRTFSCLDVHKRGGGIHTQCMPVTDKQGEAYLKTRPRSRCWLRGRAAPLTQVFHPVHSPKSCWLWINTVRIIFSS